MKLYTKKGDDGRTALFGEGRVSKDHIRICAYGEIDELNSTIGVALSMCKLEPIAKILQALQPRIFDVGTDLCTPDESPARRYVTAIDESMVTELENWIDEICEQLTPLKQFILPGGTVTAAHLHHARTVCRRAERVLITMNRTRTINCYIIHWVNRLSDLLFAMARYANHLEGVEDIPWSPKD